MSFIGEKDFGLEVARESVPGFSREFKFGQALDCDNGVATDIWDGADGTTSTDVWVPPTTARIHNLVSSSAADTAAGTGMRTTLVSGLTSWDTAEESETVILNGVTPVPTVKSYVIMHRMQGVTFGSGAANAGIITATAVTDATITAAMQIGKSQTLMAIFGLPSIQEMFLTEINFSVLRGGGGALIDGALLANERADQADSGFLTKNVFSTGESFSLVFDPRLPFSGPLILKLRATSNTNNTQVTGSFNAYIVDR